MPLVQPLDQSHDAEVMELATFFSMKHWVFRPIQF